MEIFRTCGFYKSIFTALKPECNRLESMQSLESLSFEDYISILECQPDLNSEGDGMKYVIEVRLKCVYKYFLCVR